MLLLARSVSTLRIGQMISGDSSSRCSKATVSCEAQQ
jgi:hypothetical protein